MKSLRFYISLAISIIIKSLLNFFGKDATSAPGKIAYRICPEILSEIDKRSKIKIIISGTNGKTTTNNLINHIIGNERTVLSNLKGSNMVSGIVSAFINSYRKNYDIACFEVDEGSLHLITKYIKPDLFITTNVFRDQLDRYGELDKVKNLILEHIDGALALINADDPNLASYSGENKLFYCVDENTASRKTNVTLDSRFCPVCNAQLDYLFYNVGHVGKYVCHSCGFKNPQCRFIITNIQIQNGGFVFDFIDKQEDITIRGISFKIGGIYNLYNVCAAISAALMLGIDKDAIKKKIESYENRLGRMEEMSFKQKSIVISLVKNPIGISETLKYISNDKLRKTLVFILNDNAADGKDVSWIWDADFDILSEITNIDNVYFGGKRKEDIALRVKYSSFELKNYKFVDIDSDINKILSQDVDRIYILPTYTALFKTRQIVKKVIESNKR